MKHYANGKEIKISDIPQQPSVPKESKYQFRKDELIQIFNEWKRRETANPEDFEGYEPSNYGVESAEYFLEIAQDILN